MIVIVYLDTWTKPKDQIHRSKDPHVQCSVSEKAVMKDFDVLTGDILEHARCVSPKLKIYDSSNCSCSQACSEKLPQGQLIQYG